MPFLAIDGVEVEIQTVNANESPELIGDKERMFAGNLRSTYRASKHKWENLLTGPMENSAVDALMAKNGTFVVVTGDMIPVTYIDALLTITNSQYIDRNGVDFVRYLSITIEEK